ncbi:MAG: hypothetical protein OEU54_10900 [Gemmatimonadota bacterium]|nr:hypothetical protein [Gemmatimonadota bacterium]
MIAWIKRLILLGVVAGAGFYGFQSLRAAGFQFRWERNDGGGRAADPTFARVARQVTVADTSSRTSEAAGAVTVGESAASAEGDHGRPAGVVTTVVEAPMVTDAELPPPGSGPSARIDFETIADGQPCVPCPVGEEWASRGLRVSFRSWTAESTSPYVLDGSEYLPPGSSRHALGPSLKGEVGLEVGVIRLDFPGRPRTVSFSLFGPAIIRRFDITAWSGGAILESAVARAAGRTYDPAGRGLFREELITVRAESGIDRISLDGWGPPGHILLVDDVIIIP